LRRELYLEPKPGGEIKPGQAYKPSTRNANGGPRQRTPPATLCGIPESLDGETKFVDE